jgi:uncharacterized protein
MKTKEFKEAILYFGIVLFLSYFVFWGPLAFFKIEAANLVGGTNGPKWALVLFILGGFVPSFAGIFLTALLEGKPGIKNLFRSSINVKIGLKAYLLILLIVLYYAGSLILLYTILNGKFNYSQFWIQLPTILPLIFLGPLSEEYGWRGFALNRLLKSIDPVFASLIIGLGWSLWHLPLFYMLGTSQYNFHIPFISFLISITSGSFVYTYIYLKSNKSLFAVIILHWIWTYAMQVVGSSGIRTTLYNWLECVPSVLMGIVFILLLKKEKRFWCKN